MRFDIDDLLTVELPSIERLNGFPATRKRCRGNEPKFLLPHQMER
jgi:hypothetical protein